jgi:hypothetical protein|tara:strand:+ start:858 stop:1007 length:150 start_codon:yes stop_codon:yes gene_type:complete
MSFGVLEVLGFLVALMVVPLSAFLVCKFWKFTLPFVLIVGGLLTYWSAV